MFWYSRFFIIDPTIIRIIWAALVLLYSTGLLAYFFCAIVLPEGPTRYSSSDYKNNEVDITVESEDEPYAEVEVVTDKIEKELRKNGELEDEVEEEHQKLESRKVELTAEMFNLWKKMIEVKERCAALLSDGMFPRIKHRIELLELSELPTT